MGATIDVHEWTDYGHKNVYIPFAVDVFQACDASSCFGYIALDTCVGQKAADVSGTTDSAGIRRAEILQVVCLVVKLFYYYIHFHPSLRYLQSWFFSF